MPPFSSQDEDYESSEASTSILTTTTTTTKKKKTKQMKRIVRFHPYTELSWTLCRSDYCRQERDACYPTEEEKQKRSNKHQKIVSRMERGIPCKATSSYRGLEGWTEQGRHVMDVVVSACIQSVLEHQHQHSTSTSTNTAWEAIAKASRNVSQFSNEFALDIAEYDLEQAVLAYESMKNLHSNQVKEEQSESSEVGTLDELPEPVVVVPPEPKTTKRPTAATTTTSSKDKKKQSKSKRTTTTSKGKRSSMNIYTQMNNRDFKKVLVV
jgi:hypothetical protein